MYIQENDERLPKAWTTNDGWIRAIPGFAWNPMDAPPELQLAALENGLLFPYVETTKVYRCPIAVKNELRTYSITHAMNGFAGSPILTRISQISNLGSRIVFLDDYIYDWDACWMIENAPAERWWNTTPIRHGSGGNVFSFADGHSKFWNWKDQRTIDLAEKYYAFGSSASAGNPGDPESTQPGNVDLLRVQKAVWGK